MKRALVVGLGISGKAAYNLLVCQGYEVVAVDDREGFSPDIIEQTFDKVVISPGVPKSHLLYCKGAIGEMELALQSLKGSAIGITGTNGKTTVTLMVTHVLNRCGILAKAVGNIGTPLSSAIEELGEAIAVIELSSYQLETAATCVLDTGIILNIEEDHLDRYPSFDAYAAAKLQLQTLVKGPFWVSEKLKTHYRLTNALVYDSLVETIISLEYKGIERLNALAAYAVCHHYGIEIEPFIEALSSFTYPAHRMEQVAKVGEVTFINDSKGTNPFATVAAVEGVEGPIWLIAGGEPKGCSFAKWPSAFRGKVERILLIGNARGRIKEEMGNVVPIEECGTLEKAIERCRKVKRGTVLLSPGCASFDQFPSYEARGETFRQLVRGLT